MARPARRLNACLVTSLLGALAPATAAHSAIAVSPGETDRAVEIATTCPTFSWASVESAAGYELAVFALVEREEPRLALRHTIAGAALAWTPARAECLSPATSFAWTVRALDAAGRPLAGRDDWAAPRRFTVPAAPGAEQVAAALEVLRQLQVANGGGAPALVSRAAPADPEEPAVGATTVSGVAAVRGEMPGATGANYGVVGISSSLQGAGLVGLNASIGADLVLDGSFNGQVDTAFTQSGIDRPAADTQTFNIQNSGAGVMVLQADGVPVSLSGHLHSGEEIASGTVADARLDASLARDAEVLPTVLASDGPGSTLDADTLDGLHAEQLQARVTGSCPTGEVLSGVNADGSVACTTAGGPTVRVTVDDPPTHRVGMLTSIALGSDGFPVIAYDDETAFSIKVAKCRDAVCAQRLVSTVDDSAGMLGRFVSLAVPADGLPVVAYHDDTATALKVAKCNDPACTGGDETLTIVVDNTHGALYGSLAVGADGFPVISYLDNDTDALRVAKCGDAACTVRTVSVVDDPASYVGFHTSITVGSAGFPVIAYQDMGNQDLKLALCNDAACSGGDETLVGVDVGADAVGSGISVAIATDGFPVIAYRDDTGDALKLAKCNDAVCSSRTVTTVVGPPSLSVGPDGVSLAIGNDGLPVVSLQDTLDASLIVVKCNDPACSGGDETVTTVDDPFADVGWSSAIVIAPDGLPVISYADGTNGALKLAKCGNPACR